MNALVPAYSAAFGGAPPWLNSASLPAVLAALRAGGVPLSPCSARRLRSTKACQQAQRLRAAEGPVRKVPEEAHARPSVVWNNGDTHEWSDEARLPATGSALVSGARCAPAHSISCHSALLALSRILRREDQSPPQWRKERSTHVIQLFTVALRYARSRTANCAATTRSFHAFSSHAFGRDPLVASAWASPRCSVSPSGHHWFIHRGFRGALCGADRRGRWRCVSR